jgi:GAF domain-containing protein
VVRTEVPRLARDDLLVGALSDFARTLVRRFDISDVLYELTTRVTTVLEVSSAGVSLVQDGRLRFVTALDETTATLERIQESEQAGPCIEAFRTGEFILISKIEEVESKWPVFTRQAREIGFLAVAGIPMRLDGESLGALDLYHTSPRAWSADDVRVARVLADMATSYVVNASELERQQRTTEQLELALESRVTIEQAKGIIAAERRVSIDQAFELLRRHARSHNADLRTTAEAVVQLGLRP